MKFSLADNKGFTLMEVVVAMALFVVAVVLLVDIFTVTQKTQIKLSGKTRVQADARYVMEIIARYARNYRIDYDYIVNREGGEPIPAQLTYLPLRDEADNLILFESSTSANVCPSGVSECLAIQRNNSAWASITPAGVNIQSISFFISPRQDPFTIDLTAGGYKSDNQPKVTIILISESTAVREGEKETNYLQTTVSSRVYKRY